MNGAFPGRFVDEVGRHEVAKWFAAVTNRAGPGAANHSADILRMAMNKAEAWGYRLENTNPCTGLRRNRQRKFERFLSPEQLARVGVVLKAEREGPVVLRRAQATALLLLILTGCRHSEIRELEWPDVQGNKLKLRDSKSGPRTVWLGDPARALIDSIDRVGKIRWLFWNSQRQRPIGPLNRYWAGIQAAAGLSGLRIHDLRHTFASHAAGNSETLPMIAKLLGHAKVTTTMRYAHLDDAHVLAAAQQAGDAIQRLMLTGRRGPTPLKSGSDELCCDQAFDPLHIAGERSA